MNETVSIPAPPAAPTDFDGKLNTAWEHLDGQRYPEAARLFKDLDSQKGGVPRVQAGLGSALTHLGRLDGAEKYLREAVRAEAQWGKLLLPLAQRLRGRGETERAVGLLQEAIRANPKDVDAILFLVQILRGRRQPENAANLLIAALKQQPNEEKLSFELCLVRSQQGKLEEALQCAESMLKMPRVPTKAFEVWCELMRNLKRGAELQERLEQLVRKSEDQPTLWMALGEHYAREGRPAAALPAFNRAAQLTPQNPRPHIDAGVCLRFLGQLDESRARLEQALALNPKLPNALRILGQDHKYAYGDPMFARLNRVSADVEEMTPQDRSHLHYALGKAFDDVGELDAAFAHYATAGRIMRRLNPFSERDAIRLEQSLKQYVNADVIRTLSGQGNADPRPVFVLGMPRSGTSLLEQVLSSHPDVHGAGELKLMGRVLQGIVIGKVRLDLQSDGFWPLDQKVDYTARGGRYVEELVKLAPPQAQRIVDKMPGNYLFAGLIHLVLPNSRIIHSRRHPVETCLSLYRIRFVEGHHWSYDLAELGRQYARYTKVMAHWREALPPGRMLEIRYEDMVADLETQARRIIDYLGLPWDDRCLHFHETERAVRTASAAQVRKPVYTTSVNRWRRYEAHLQPLLEELGDLVAEYEDEVAASTARLH